MKKLEENKMKVINDLLDKKFEQLNKIKGGNVAQDGCYVPPGPPKCFDSGKDKGVLC